MEDAVISSRAVRDPRRLQLQARKKRFRGIHLRRLGLRTGEAENQFFEILRVKEYAASIESLAEESPVAREVTILGRFGYLSTEQHIYWRQP